MRRFLCPNLTCPHLPPSSWPCLTFCMPTQAIVSCPLIYLTVVIRLMRHDAYFPLSGDLVSCHEINGCGEWEVTPHSTICTRFGSWHQISSRWLYLKVFASSDSAVESNATSSSPFPTEEWNESPLSQSQSGNACWLSIVSLEPTNSEFVQCCRVVLTDKIFESDLPTSFQCWCFEMLICSLFIHQDSIPPSFSCAALAIRHAIEANGYAGPGIAGATGMFPSYFSSLILDSYVLGWQLPTRPWCTLEPTHCCKMYWLSKKHVWSTISKETESRRSLHT